MLAVVVAPHGFTTAFASQASILPRASHRQITPTACPGRILRAEPQVRYPLILTASHAASCHTPPSKLHVQLSLHAAFQHQRSDSVRERDTFRLRGRPAWRSRWHVWQSTSVLRRLAAMIFTQSGFFRPSYLFRSLSALI
jgi:hypothetical protein